MKIVKQDCNLSIRRGWEWIEKTDRWLWDLRQDGGKSVGYNCCHPSQVCPGTLAYIHTLLLEDKTKGSTSPLPSIHHPPFTSFCTHLLHIFLNRYGEKGLPVALYVLEDCAEDPVQVDFEICLKVCVVFVWPCHLFNFCAFAHPCCEGGRISGATQCPLPSRHSFHPTWQNLSLPPPISLLPLSFSFTWLIYPFVVSSSFFSCIAAFCSVFFPFFCLRSISFSLLPWVDTAVPTGAT